MTAQESPAEKLRREWAARIYNDRMEQIYIKAM